MREAAAGRQWRISLQMAVALVATVLLVTVVASLAWAAYRGAQRALLSAADEAVVHVGRTLDESLRRIFEPADNQLRLLVHSELARARTEAQRLAQLPLAVAALEGNPLLDALYAGYGDGDFVLFRGLPDAAALRAFDAPPASRWLVQTQSDDERGTAHRGAYHFFDAQLRAIERRPLPDYQFDPRTRPWYQRAEMQSGTVITDPYLFFTTREVGTTLARRAPQGQVVLGLDATLHSLAHQLGKLKLTPGSEIVIIDGAQNVLAYLDASRMLRFDAGLQRTRLVTLKELGIAPLLQAAALPRGESAPLAAQLQGRAWRLVAREIASRDDRILSVLMAIPDDELFAGAQAILHQQLQIALILLLLSVPLGWLLARQLVRPLQRLAEETRAIEGFDFTPTPPLNSHISEVQSLASATRRMKGTISNFIDTNVALSSETQLERLLETVLRNARQAAQAEIGAIYLLEDAETLVLALSEGLSAAPRLNFTEHAEHIVVATARERRSLVSAGNLVAAPLLTRDGSLVGVMCLELARALQSTPTAADPRIGFVEALASTGAVAIETRNLIAQQRALLESFIQLIAQAIDAKSRYTGGHCQRVPELAKALAQAADRSTLAPLADFKLSEDDWEALHIAAWLHDCGKVTTPEHVVDKASKLECLYNRIHEIRMRFEVLKRDAHIDALQARLAGAKDEAAAAAALQQQWQQLDDEFAFVARCNLGGEAMADADIERLQQIAQRSWWRSLDERLGLSWEELQRYAASPPAALPVREALLADRAEHCMARAADQMLGEDNPWGFRIEVPPLKYNLGELYNLCIQRGTLTREDRYIINEHIVQTIKMLEGLPFPRHLAAVPEIAGGHHERMDGKGYPRRLMGGQLSVLARVMAIADVFEALTASDRPYKRANSLAQAVGIMARMVREHHLDPLLFRVFLEEGVFLSYATRFLTPEQCDTVDVAAALAAAAC